MNGMVYGLGIAVTCMAADERPVAVDFRPARGYGGAFHMHGMNGNKKAHILKLSPLPHA